MTRIHAPRRIRHLPAHGALPTLRAVNTDTSDPPPAAASTERCLFLTVNGQSAAHTVPAHTTLAQLLRERLHLTGTKVACDQAACGACTVLLDGQAVFACHTLAAQCDGADVRTIEGLAAADGTLHPLQQAFIDHDALQCGFCTPGMLMALHAALQGARERAEVPDRDALAHAIAGNLCRCGAYPHILEAALDVAGRR
jgi:xanthine dehydrogenase YagT iron-sulfur-binding subunit